MQSSQELNVSENAKTLKKNNRKTPSISEIEEVQQRPQEFETQRRDSRASRKDRKILKKPKPQKDQSQLDTGLGSQNSQSNMSDGTNLSINGRIDTIEILQIKTSGNLQLQQTTNSSQETSFTQAQSLLNSMKELKSNQNIGNKPPMLKNPKAKSQSKSRSNSNSFIYRTQKSLQKKGHLVLSNSAAKKRNLGQPNKAPIVPKSTKAKGSKSSFNDYLKNAPEYRKKSARRNGSMGDRRSFSMKKTNPLNEDIKACTRNQSYQGFQNMVVKSDQTKYH